MLYLKMKLRSCLSLTIIIVLVIAFAALSYKRNSIWIEETTLWDDAIKKSPKKARPYLSHGLAFHKIGQYEKAIKNPEIDIDSSKIVKPLLV